MILVSSMHLNAAAEQSPSRASLGLLCVSLRHRIVAVVWLGAVRRRSLPGSRSGSGLPIGGAGGGTKGSLGTDMISSSLAGKTRVSFRLFKRWRRERDAFLEQRTARRRPYQQVPLLTPAMLRRLKRL